MEINLKLRLESVRFRRTGLHGESIQLRFERLLRHVDAMNPVGTEVEEVVGIIWGRAIIASLANARAFQCTHDFKRKRFISGGVDCDITQERSRIWRAKSVKHFDRTQEPQARGRSEGAFDFC
jgi:hypothetical protein